MLGTAACLAAALTGCGGSPALDVAAPSPLTAPAPEVCRRLHAGLPQEVEQEPRRETRPASDLTAAWGEPAIVLRCGVPLPAYSPTAENVVVNEVEWLVSERGEAVVFTTFHRVVPVEVAVPRAYAPEVNPLVDLAAAIRAQVPEDDGVPSPQPGRTGESGAHHPGEHH